jgi:hypothetical protein
MAPEMAAALVKSPINKQKPIINNPQILRKSTICSAVLLFINQWKKPENSHFDSIR